MHNQPKLPLCEPRDIIQVWCETVNILWHESNIIDTLWNFSNGTTCIPWTTIHIHFGRIYVYK